MCNLFCLEMKSPWDIFWGKKASLRGNEYTLGIFLPGLCSVPKMSTRNKVTRKNKNKTKFIQQDREKTVPIV